MNPIKIAIVEDESIIASLIEEGLKKYNYEVAKPAMNYAKAIELMQRFTPDLIFLDIRLSGKKDGIQLAEYIREHYAIPIIFLTANSDKETIERAKQVNPDAFLIKPFTAGHLYAAVEMAMHNYEQQRNEQKKKPTSILLKQGYEIIKVLLQDIVFIESEGNYLNVITAQNQQITIRSTINEMMLRLPVEMFGRINRSCLVNLSLVQEIEKNHLLIHGIKMELSAVYRKEVLEKLQSI